MGVWEGEGGKSSMNRTRQKGNGEPRTSRRKLKKSSFGVGGRCGVGGGSDIGQAFIGMVRARAAGRCVRDVTRRERERENREKDKYKDRERWEHGSGMTRCIYVSDRSGQPLSSRPGLVKMEHVSTRATLAHRHIPLHLQEGVHGRTSPQRCC